MPREPRAARGAPSFSPQPIEKVVGIQTRRAISRSARQGLPFQ